MNTAVKYLKVDLYSSSQVEIYSNLRLYFVLWYNADAEILVTGNSNRRKETTFFVK